MTVADIRIICGLPEALSAITRFAACVLVTVESAVKLMMMRQLWPELSVLGQKATPRKPVESSPEIEAMLKLVKVTMELPELVTINVSMLVLPV